MKLISIPKEQYDEYRLDLIFNCYKWDPQFLDNNTVAKHVLVITKEEHEQLKRYTEMLDKETREAEKFLNNNLKLAKPLALPRQINKELKKMKNYDENKHVRLMRYDFHPVIGDKWAISEVNSDVPGGFAEASLMPKRALELLKNNEYWSKNFGDALVNAIKEKVKPNGRIMMVHCTSYSDDRQVMQFLGDRLKTLGFEIIYAAADHLKFENNEAISVLDENEGKVDGIFRFTPLEWLIGMKPKRWQGYFDTITPSCNHPIAIFAQTKRFPLIWESLEAAGIDLSTWRELLPETIEVRDAKEREGFIYKPACGRVGEKISIKEACVDDEYEKILKDVRKHPKQYLAQKRFDSRPLTSDEGENFHVCLGSYAVDGKHGGYYARISKTPRIDSNAADIPVLIEGGAE
ncbi:MAG: glutathionylspermidine synthase family protein [Clostridia bacterium]|nr:glutathionylspermidine synthase family protein [Clostridia bacterium]